MAKQTWRWAALFAMSMAASAAGAQPGACPALRWTTLGTAGGPVPTSDRSEPANLLAAGEQLILVDTGDGTVDNLARVGVTLGQVRSVFISHLHLDHTGGLAAVIGLRWMNQFPGKLTIYGPPGTRQVVEGILASMGPPSQIGFGLGEPPRPPSDSVEVVELSGGDKRTLGDLRVSAVANSHFDHDGAAAQGSQQSLSYRFDLAGRSITYTGDSGPSAVLAPLASGTDLLVSEVIDLDRLLAEIRARRTDAPAQMFENMRRHLSTHHLAPEEIGRIAAQSKAKHVVLTHFAIPGPLAVSEPTLRSGIRASYSGPVDLARDLSSFDVACR